MHVLKWWYICVWNDMSWSMESITCEHTSEHKQRQSNMRAKTRIRHNKIYTANINTELNLAHR